MRYKITISYDGSAFCGWQIQPDAPSVQACLEDGLSALLGGRTAVTGAGRTDSGVNAFRYVAHFDTEFPVADCRELARRLNAMLPAQVTVHSVEEAGGEFHARFDATRREYTYFLHRVKDPFVAKYSYFYGYPVLDFDAMNRAAGDLLGRHDFSCFEKTGTDTKTAVCTVFEAGWHQYVPTLQSVCGGAPDGNYWYFRIAADRFLRNMVRAVVGTLLEIGRGKRPEGSIAEIVGPVPGNTACPAADALRTSRRSLAGESVPGHALFLDSVSYPED